MKDLTSVEHKLVNDLALSGAKKTEIASIIGCSDRTILNSIHRSFPSDGSSEITTRQRKTGFYLVKQQQLDTILEYVLHHPWATNLEIAAECGLKTTSRATISRWLKSLGIGSYIAMKRQGITPTNADKRQASFLIFNLF